VPALNVDVLVTLVALTSDPMLVTDSHGGIVWVNPAFEACSGRHLVDVQGHALGTLLVSPEPVPVLAGSDETVASEHGLRLADGSELRVRARRTRIGGAGDPQAVVACVLDNLDAQDEARRAAEVLDVARQFGRIGVWERDIASGKGRFDERVLDFLGFAPGSDVPSFDEVAQHLHPGDRKQHAYRQSLSQAGNYVQRFRIVRPDGRIRLLQSQWKVVASEAGVPSRVVGLLVDDTEAHELARANNETGEQLALAVELGNIAIWRQDLTTRRFSYNAKASEMLGLAPSADGVLDETLRGRIHPDDRALVAGANRSALTSPQPVDVEARYARADGRWQFVLSRRVARRNEDGVPFEVLGVALDVTQQVEKTRRAAALARRLDIATSAAELAIWSRDIESQSGEWNAQMFQFFDRDPALGVPSRDGWLLLMHPDDRPRMALAREQLMQDRGGAVEHEYRVIRPSGELRWITQRARMELIDGRRTLLGVSMDVTARVRTEAALRSVNERIGLSARATGLGSWEWDTVTDESVWDESMFTLRGLTPRADAPSADERVALLHPDDRVQAVNAMRDAVLSLRAVAQEFRVVWPDGSVHWLASRATPVPEADGRVQRYIGVNWDVTTRVNAEAARQESLINQRKSEAKSEFLARISHELRTPLNAVLGFAQLLQIDHDRGAPAQRAHIDHVRSAGEHLLSMINDVLDLSSLESGQLRFDLTPVRMADVVAEVLPMMQSLASHFGIAVHAEAITGSVRVDRTRLRQILINLLSNAIKYNRPQGEVRISTQREGNALLLCVSDTGRGLSAGQLDQLFEPFNRLGIESQNIEGTGIGLAIVKALVDRMQGSIRVSSSVGEGSVFEVRLPVDGLDAPIVQATSARKGSILYIEDNPVNVLLVEELVSSRDDLRIVSVATGAEGVSQARALLPDLVLVDMQLPDFDGFEVLRRLRAQPDTAALTCIALSANAVPEDIALALKAGFSEYWTKPINLRAFLASLAAVFPPRAG